MKYIDVIRSTHTDLDVAQAKRNDDFWNNGFHKIYIIERNSSESFCVVRKETDKNTNDITSRLHMIWRLDKNWKKKKTAQRRDG